MKTRFYVLLLLVLCMPTAGYACSPVPRTADSDAAIIERAAAVVNVKVLSVMRNDNVASLETIATAELEILDVYKGDLKKGAHITALSKNLGTCSNILSEGVTADILLFEDSGTYFLGSSTDFLFPETWLRLKQNH